MNCIQAEGKFCGQTKCQEIATCWTTVSGFRVPACKKHHVCDRVIKGTKGSLSPSFKVSG